MSAYNGAGSQQWGDQDRDSCCLRSPALSVCLLCFNAQVLPTVAQAFLELLPPRGIRWVRLPVEQLDAPVEGDKDSDIADETNPIRTVLSASLREFLEEIMKHAVVSMTREHQEQQVMGCCSVHILGAVVLTCVFDFLSMHPECVSIEPVRSPHVELSV